jgi:hypothetical protein
MFGRGITIGADYSTPENIMRSVERMPPAQRAAVLATLFPGVLPPVSHQAIGAMEDIDGDGKPENVLDQWMPLTGAAGLSIAFGTSGEVDITPQRLFKPGILSAVARVVAIEDLIVTAFTMGIEPQLIATGGIPLAAFQHDSTYKLLSSHWVGPGVPLRMTIANVAASGTAKIFGVWFGDAVSRS